MLITGERNVDPLFLRREPGGGVLFHIPCYHEKSRGAMNNRNGFCCGSNFHLLYNTTTKKKHYVEDIFIDLRLSFVNEQPEEALNW